MGRLRSDRHLQADLGPLERNDDDPRGRAAGFYPGDPAGGAVARLELRRDCGHPLGRHLAEKGGREEAFGGDLPIQHPHQLIGALDEGGGRVGRRGRSRPEEEEQQGGPKPAQRVEVSDRVSGSAVRSSISILAWGERCLRRLPVAA